MTAGELKVGQRFRFAGIDIDASPCWCWLTVDNVNESSKTGRDDLFIKATCRRHPTANARWFLTTRQVEPEPFADAMDRIEDQ
jgi:hypothetical protein